jgi:glycosyltransferase involved in cell wall biosynthesis
MRAPRVSIGLPVYNGTRFLSDAITSVLSQSYEDFELIISDNASTDATGEICRAFSARDRRVRYHRMDVNRGASANFNHTFEMARGEFFRWHSDDDLLAPTYLQRCVAALDADASAVLAHTQTLVIDERGEAITELRYDLDHVASPDPRRRLADVLRTDRWCFDVFGLTRSAALARTRKLDRYVASDRILRAELALQGRFRIVDEPLFLNRDHPDRSVRKYPAHHLRAEWFDPRLAGTMVLPHWRILSEYWMAMGRHPLTLRQRAACRLELMAWLGRDLNWARLGADVLLAAVPRLGPALIARSRAEETWLLQPDSGAGRKRSQS